jgi:hypothetical protein
MVLDTPISTAQQDILVGTNFADTFLLPQLSWSLLGAAGNYKFDTITGFQTTDRIQLSGRTFATSLTSSIGIASSLSASEIANKLTPSWAVNSVRAFTVTGYSGTFIAMNDAQAGYQADKDAIIFLQGYNLSAMNAIVLI